MDTIPLPMWKQRGRDMVWYPKPAPAGPFSPWAPLHSGGSTATLDGEDFSRDEDIHVGNRIDALPYWSRKVTVDVPFWDASLEISRLPDEPHRYEQRGDGRAYTAINDYDFTATSSNSLSAEEAKFVRDLAIMKAQASLRKADASIPMMMKERIETLNMMKSYAGRGLDLIRRRQLKDVSRWKKLSRSPREQRKLLAQIIANEHLMFVFGMLPLLEDLEGLAEHVMRDEHKFIKGRGRMAQLRETKSFKSYGNFSTLTKKEALVSVRVSLRADISVEVLGRAQKLGFNPLYTLYDFTPLSFITGWFSNFNFWVQSLDPLYGSVFRTGSISTRTTMTVKRECYATPSPNVVAKGNGKSQGTSTFDRREVVSSMPPQGDLAFYNNLSFFSVTAGISLFVQRKVKLAQKAIRIKPFRYKSPRPVNLPPIKYSK